MKADIDALMQAYGLDALWVMGSGQNNPAMVYLTGGSHLTYADLIIKRGQTGVLFHGPMERDEAAKSGLDTRSYSNYPLSQLLKESGGNPLRANLLRYKKMLQDVGVKSGRLALYGQVEFGPTFTLLNALNKEMPGLELVGFQENDILAEAMMTKDASELDRIRKMGQITTTVVAKTADFLSGHPVKDGALVKSSGEPLTIGEVKRKINLWLAELGAENPKGTIFATGRDAGVPHSTGDAAGLLRLGQTIVYDIFPCEPGGGYFYDFTRTWCLGYAPDDVQALYENVRTVYNQVSAALTVKEPFKKYQRLTCELFEQMGHPTILSVPETEAGYVHSLGHGVGLKVHERPASGSAALAGDILVPGVVATLEPGLYYPERGMGVRLEDTFWVTPDGKFEIFAPYPQDLVLPVRQA
jgi:Xaa-Pro aminopeptidase